MIPSDWRLVKIQNLVDEAIIAKPLDGNHGAIHPTGKDYVEEGIPFILANDIKNGILDLENCKFIRKEQADNLQKGFAEENDVLLTHKGTVGNVTIVPRLKTDYIMLTPQVTYYRVLDYSRLDNHYLKLYFESHSFQRALEKYSGGGTRAYIGITAQRKLQILLPPLPEQRKIAEILGTWDKATDLTEQRIEAAQQRKKALMQQLLTGHVRFHEFVHSIKRRETKFGDLPAEWEYVPMSKVAKEVNVRNQKDQEYPVLSCTKHYGLVNSLEYFGRQIFSDDLSSYKVVKRGQFAYATNHIEEGSIGYQDLHDMALISPMYTVFETNDQVDDSFLYKVLKTEKYRHIFEINTNGTVNRRGSLRWKPFSRIHIPLPSLAEQHCIAAILEACDREIELLTKKRDALQRQKKGLMQQLLTGRTRVKAPPSNSPQEGEN